MKVCILRGSQEIGGMATEISTTKTRLVVDMGDQLSLDPDFVSPSLDISGVTDDKSPCHGVLFTHYHGDHTGQILAIRPGLPLYAGPLAKDIMALTAGHSWKRNPALSKRIASIQSFFPGRPFSIGDIEITPFSIDHSACDSYMFLIEADGQRLLYTGDFRLHGIRGKAMDKILDTRVGKVHALIIEGTTLSRPDQASLTEWDLQNQVRDYLKKYKYVFVLCSTTNLDRIFALARAVPYGKYCICDSYQKSLMEAVSRHWSGLSSFYQMPKLTTYGDNLLPNFQRLGGLMFIRANKKFAGILRQLNRKESILLYSMWKGYRTRPGSKLPEFLSLAGSWTDLHTSGHASPKDLTHVIERVDPDLVIPMHTEAPQRLAEICPNRKVLLVEDGEELTL